VLLSPEGGIVISADRLQKSLTYLAETDEPCAKAKSLMIGLERQEKTILAMQYLGFTGTVEERKAKAQATPQYQNWRETYEQAVFDYELMKNKRSTEEMVIECWRSLNANQRRGNIT
jgi:hypothetical protein